jgi:hypothetical protein
LDRRAPIYHDPVASHRKNHIASRAYLRQWTDENGRLSRAEGPNGVSEERTLGSVGYRQDFWGRDPEVRERAEKVTSQFESKAAPVLRNLAERWPLTPGSPDWFAMSLFLGLHFMRNPAGPQRLVQVQADVLGRRLPHYTKGWTHEQTEDFLRTVTSEDFRLQVLLDQVVKAASVLGSMHWTLVEFPAPLLATSDQPVSIVPLLAPGENAPVMPLLKGPVFNAEEMRIAIGPRHALLLTWLNEPCGGPALRAGDDVAAELNRATIGQQDQEWFHHPARRPTRLIAPLFSEIAACGSLGRKLLAGYDFESATASPRRWRALANLHRMVEKGTKDRVEIVAVKAA